MTKTAAPPVAKPGARDRLLASASELFYAEGIHTVGIDRIIEHAGVAKASLYNTFGSKDELVRAYLQERHSITAERINAAMSRWDEPRDRILGVYVVQGERMAEPGYRGCAFASASAESPAGSAAERAAGEYRGWLRGIFADLATAAGARDPDALAVQLVLLYDGAALSARMDGNPRAAESARVAAAALLDAALSH